MSGNYNFNRHETVTNVVFNFLGEVVDINEIHNDLIKFENEMNELKKTIIRYKRLMMMMMMMMMICMMSLKASLVYNNQLEFFS